MEVHKFQEGKFPVGDSLIHNFNKLILSKIDNCWVAGGALTSYLSGEKIKDIDLFFATRKDAAKAVLLIRKEYNFKLHFTTNEAIKGSAEINGRSINIDIVKRCFKDPIETIQDFDFTVCCLAVDQNSFYYHEKAPFDILRKKLVVNSLPFPVSTTRRMCKYIKRGYSICNGTILEILTAVRGVSDQDFGIIDFYPID